MGTHQEICIKWPLLTKYLVPKRGKWSVLLLFDANTLLQVPCLLKVKENVFCISYARFLQSKKIRNVVRGVLPRVDRLRRPKSCLAKWKAKTAISRPSNTLVEYLPTFYRVETRNQKKRRSSADYRLLILLCEAVCDSKLGFMNLVAEKNLVTRLIKRNLLHAWFDKIVCVLLW